MNTILTRKDLLDLGVPAGPLIKQIFNVCKGKSREESLEIAIQIRDGTWIPIKTDWSVKEGSALEFLVNFRWCPSTQNTFPASLGEKRRLLEQGAVTINSKKPQPNDPISFPIEELVFFQGAKRQITIR